MNTARSHSLHVINTPFCGDLRSKKFYMNDGVIPTCAEDYHDISGYLFCYQTQSPVGLDGYRAEPETCTPGRECYRSALDSPGLQSPKPNLPNIV